jgi:Peptidase family M1 domain
MKRTTFALLLLSVLVTATQAQQLYMPRNVQNAYKKGTRSMDGAPGKNYWQNTADYKIAVTAAPPNRTVTGKETITYTNNSPDTLKTPVIKLILNIHKPGAARQGAASEAYLTKGIIIDKCTENGTDKKLRDAGSNTLLRVPLSKPILPNASVTFTFDWHYDVSEQSGREGMLDSTSFFLAYFYPRVAVFDDIDGWDRMVFTDAQEFYNDFNNYELSVTVPKNYLVWATGELRNTADVLQPAFAAKFAASKTSDKIINVVTQADIDAKNITLQNETNTWKWNAQNISDVAVCISNHYVWDAASVVVDNKTGRRSSVQAAYNNRSVNFKKSVEYSHHTLDWMSNNWPGVPYPFPSSTIVEGFADMEYPMMANDSHQPEANFQRFVAEHEIAHTWFPFYMGINEHRYGCMDEGWTTAFENLIGKVDLGEETADNFFKQFRVSGWATDPDDESQVPIITPANILSGAGLGHNEYGKPAVAYLGLKDMLGDDVFRKCLHGFMDRWHGKHPIPWDMFNSFNNLSGKDLNWYWQNWFFSNNYTDIAVKDVRPVATGYTLTIENIGGFAIPTNIMIEYTDGSKEKIHQTAGIWQKSQKLATVNINTKKKIAFLKLDNGIFMDADETNSWGKAKAVTAVTTVPATEPAFDAKTIKTENLDKYLGNYASTAIPIKISFSKEGAVLIADASGQGKINLTQTGVNKFEFADAGVVIEFTPGKNEFVLSQGGGKFTFNKE